uniref:Cysteine-rich protein n=1 Tax=Apriona germarii TaxID=157307 RepID=Q5DIE2_APRGE|nr:cysteine-rich protein [Apriona germarii]
MKVFLIVLFVTIFVMVAANQEEPEQSLVEGVPLDGKIYRQARGICYVLTCNSLCFPKLGRCSYNTCYCY